jgi:uncharacterized protein
MGKVLVWVVVVLLVWLGWRLWTVSQRRIRNARDAAAAGARRQDGEGDRGGRRPDAPELMMQCAVCGTHVPGSEARFAGGRVYCSDEHRDEDARGATAPAEGRRDRR